MTTDSSTAGAGHWSAVRIFIEQLYSSVLVCGNITTADFKYSSTTKANTLEQDLIHGFRQARSIVLKLENIDSGNFSDAVEYMLRNEKRLEFRIGNIRILNKYGKYRDITRADMRRNTYAKKIKGIPIKESL